MLQKENKTLLDGRGDPPGIKKCIDIWPYFQMGNAQTGIRLRE